MVKDTSIDYDDLVEFQAEENRQKNLVEFLDLEEETSKYNVKPKPIDPEFPEEWQTLLINFGNEEDYFDFMSKLEETPVPKLKKLVYRIKKDNGLLSFM